MNMYKCIIPACVCAWAAAGGADYDGPGVAGVVAEDTTWAGDVYLAGDLYVAPGATLTLEPGTRVTVSREDALSKGILIHGDSRWVEVEVAGTLVLNGTPEARVVFVPEANGSPDEAWSGFELKKGGSFKADGAWLVGARRPWPSAAALSEDVYAVVGTRKLGTAYLPYWGRDRTGNQIYFYPDGKVVPKEVIKAHRGYSRWIIAPSVAFGSFVFVALASLGDIDVIIKTSDFIVNLRWAIPVGIFALGYVGGNALDSSWGARCAQDKWLKEHPDFTPLF